MRGFFNWVFSHEIETLLIAGMISAICYVVAHRESLFYRE